MHNKAIFFAVVLTCLSTSRLGNARDGNASLASNDGGPTFAPAYAAYYEFEERGQQRVTVLLTSHPNVCTTLQRFKARPN